MSIFQPNPEGIEALRNLSSGLEENLDRIKSAADSLRSSVDGQAGLGPHTDSISDIIDSINTAILHAQDPVHDLCSRVNEVADAYQDVVDNDPFSGIM